MANASGLASIVILFVVPITWVPEQMIEGLANGTSCQSWRAVHSESFSDVRRAK
jgi:hypothetical protein